MAGYLLINLFIAVFPFILSFDKRTAYYKRWKAFFKGFLIVGVVFIVWDAFATYRGHWGFNPEQLIGLNLLTLPLEEVLFFLTVPFSCIFVYEVLNYFFKDELVKFPERLPVLISIILLIIALFFIVKEYTFIVLLSAALFFALAEKLMPGLLSSLNYWRWLIICYGLFLLINYLLTSIPIVVYDEGMITGFRVFTIPFEDFVYNFSLLSFFLAVYLRGVKHG